MGVAVIGAGNISKQYLDNLTVFPDLKVHVIADLFEDAAAARAKEYGIAECGGVDAALNHPDVEIIVNLTIPAAHVEVATAAVNAGKHVWTEKPFSLDRESGLGLLKTADAAGLRLGCAPDTFLGAGLQTARRLIERGDIGTPLTAMTTFQTPGPESWHPNPAFLFQYGAGPLFDMGPYYLTALVQTFGSVRQRGRRRVQGQGGPRHRLRAQGRRGIHRRGPHPRVRHGPVRVRRVLAQRLQLRVPAAADGLRGDHRDRGHHLAAGSELLRRRRQALARRRRGLDRHPGHRPSQGRGMGVLDMARSIRAGVPHRATGDLAYHVLDTMVSISESIDSGTFIDVESSAPASAALPEDWDPTASTL